MENTTKTDLRARDVYYYRQRFKNRVFDKIASFVSEQAAKKGVTRRQIAQRLGRDPAQVTRWLTSPSNLTLDSISDLLLALDAEADPPDIISFEDRPTPNYVHPLIQRITGQPGSKNLTSQTLNGIWSSAFTSSQTKIAKTYSMPAQ